jgi:integrase
MTNLSFESPKNRIPHAFGPITEDFAGKADRRTSHRLLAVTGWTSEYKALTNLLDRLKRRRRREGTRRSYLWHIAKFCSYSKRTPDELVKLNKSQAEKLVQKYSDSLLETSPRYSNLSVYILKVFYSANGFKRERELEVESCNVPPRFRMTKEYIPTKTEVYRMADSASSLRNRAIILTLFSSGLRNSTLRVLRFGDIKNELSQDQINILLPVYPSMKEVDPQACKGGIPYYVFTCDEATQAIKLYIRQREEEHGSIGDSELVFSSSYNQIGRDDRKRKPLSERQLQIIVKTTAKAAGIKEWKYVHPHCLRKAFDTVLHSSLADGTSLNTKVQEFFMGHILPGSQDYYFDRSKTQQMRIIYSKLKFGRVNVENKFGMLRNAVARAFEDTDIDPDQLMEEYLKLKNGG